MNENVLPPELERLLAEQGLFQNKYRLKSRLGEGSFATVIQAEHETMGRDVALKFLRPDVLKAHPEVGKRFLLEVKLASRLSSPHTVTIFDFGETKDGLPFMVLEYVDGKTLDYAIEKYGALGLKRSMRITLQILDSLEEAHANNIIHRDLKPANIMVGKPQRHRRIHAKVLDFGVAKLLNADKVKTESGRQSTQFIGTPRYMSPEQILGQKISAASDLYSLGLIFYEMCTGEDSIEEDSVAQVAQFHLDDAPLPLKKLKELPLPLQEIIRRATARKVENRFPDAKTFRAAIDEILEKRKRRKEPIPLASSPDNAPQNQTDSGVSRRTSDVFSGKGYLESPEEPEETTPGTSSSRGGNRPLTPGPRAPLRQPSSAGRSRSKSRSGSRASSQGSTRLKSSELDLDLDSVEEQQRERHQRRRRSEKREKSLEAHHSRQYLRLWVGSLAALMVSGYLGFSIVGGALGMLATPMRFVAALLPLGLALLWSIFSPNPYRDLARKRMVPWAKRAAIMVVISVLVLMVTIPETARDSLRSDALWFVDTWPDGLHMNWFASLTESICDATSWLMHQAVRWVPWA